MLNMFSIIYGLSFIRGFARKKCYSKVRQNIMTDSFSIHTRRYDVTFCEVNVWNVADGFEYCYLTYHVIWRWKFNCYYLVYVSITVHDFCRLFFVTNEAFVVHPYENLNRNIAVIDLEMGRKFIFTSAREKKGENDRRDFISWQL